MLGVFDSGRGGLGALARLRACLPDADVAYLADTKHLPYGLRRENSEKLENIQKTVGEKLDGVQKTVDEKLQKSSYFLFFAASMALSRSASL